MRCDGGREAGVRAGHSREEVASLPFWRKPSSHRLSACLELPGYRESSVAWATVRRQPHRRPWHAEGDRYAIGLFAADLISRQQPAFRTF